MSTDAPSTCPAAWRGLLHRLPPGTLCDLDIASPDEGIKLFAVMLRQPKVQDVSFLRLRRGASVVFLEIDTSATWVCTWGLAALRDIIDFSGIVALSFLTLDEALRAKRLIEEPPA